MRRILAVLPLLGAGPAPTQPVVLELFTSQGCSSCPPADLAVARAAVRPRAMRASTRPGVLATASTRPLGRDAPFTPEVVARATTMVSAASGKVTVAAGVAPRRGADVWLVRYDPRTIQAPVKAGENGGKTLPQRNVVRSLERLGEWRGEAASFTATAGDAALRSVVLVQGKDGGPILAAARL